MYEVYVCKQGDKVIYVGQGKVGRHKHCSNGCSHVYDLNRLHFSGESVEVKVEFVPTKEEALTKEKFLINMYKPKFNKIGVSDDRYDKAKERSRFKSLFVDRIKSEKLSEKRTDRLLLAFDEFLHYHSSTMVSEEGILLRSKGKYNTAGLTYLSGVSKDLYYSNKGGKITTAHVFAEAIAYSYEIVYGKKCVIKFSQDDSQYFLSGNVDWLNDEFDGKN